MQKREIKFRAWDGERMCAPFTLKWLWEDDGTPMSVERIFMQYTGLKDKNGKDCYELMEIDNKHRVIYQAPGYVLQDISTGDIIPIYDQFEITGDYSPIS